MDCERERGSTRRVWILVFAFTLFLSAAWVVFDELFAPLDDEGETVTVPDYTGAHTDSLIFPEWLELETEYRYDDDRVAGTVISQSPTGGSRRKITEARPTCKLTLTVSLGTESVYLPNVLGTDVRHAESALRQKGFAVRTEVKPGAYPEGVVYDMSPRGDAELPRGSMITLFVSAGTPAVTVTVPNVIGMQRGEALTALWLAQLSVAEIIEEESDAEEGRVIRQNYQSGTVVMAGTRMTLTVSRQKE